jgi:hypothetical protein
MQQAADKCTVVSNKMTLRHDRTLEADDVLAGLHLVRVGEVGQSQPSRMGHRDRGYPAHLAGCGDGRGPGDQPAPPVTHHDGVAGTEGADDAGDVGSQGAGVVPARGFVARAVPAQVHGGGAEAGLRHCWELMAPGPPELGEAVQEQHERTVPDHRNVEAGTVGRDHPVLPRAADPCDGGVRSRSASRHSPIAGA